MSDRVAPTVLTGEALGRLEEEEDFTPPSAVSEPATMPWDEPVSPASIARTQSLGSTRRPIPSRQDSLSTPTKPTAMQSDLQMSPPPTPRRSRDLGPGMTFHNYLRAFYHFHPSSTVTSSTNELSITIPINQGDVILVHSIHPNGWADGTLLASGARGWLPTNYCEAYDPPPMRNLLTALTHLWDLVRSGENDNLGVFTRQDYVRGMIAGVRVFLERTNCLSRESALIARHVGLRRLRKGLLGDLSYLVKISKELQATLQPECPTTAVFELLDELVLKASKVVIRAMRFLDVWSQELVVTHAARGPESAGFGGSSSITISQNRLLTPPAEKAACGAPANDAQQDDGEEQPRNLLASCDGNDQGAQVPAHVHVHVDVMQVEGHARAGDAVAGAVADPSSWTACFERSPPAVPPAHVIMHSGGSVMASRDSSHQQNLQQNLEQQQRQHHNHHLQQQQHDAQTLDSGWPASEPSSDRLSALVPRPLTLPAKRVSVSHRLSDVGKSAAAAGHNLASVRLGEAKEFLLTLLATFISSQLQSRSSQELRSTTHQVTIACRGLLAVVDEVWARDGCRSPALAEARNALHAHLAELTHATLEMSSQGPGDVPLIFDDDRNAQFVGISTGCIRAAGECVNQATRCIERIGDFEFEHGGSGLVDDVFDMLAHVQSNSTELTAGAEMEDSRDQQLSAQRPSVDVTENIPEIFEKPLPMPPRPTRPPPLVLAATKPLPSCPEHSPTQSEPLPSVPQTPMFEKAEGVVELSNSPPASSLRSLRLSAQRLSAHRLSTQLHVPRKESQDISPVSTASSYQSPDAASARFYGRTIRVDSVNTSAADAHSSWRNSSHRENDSEVSLASTRATTPDRSPVAVHSGEYPPLSGNFRSMSELHSLASDTSAIEEAVLEKTYALELVYNKEGQITGGSLPALVEKLTTHYATPDAVFTNTFYLTFRLFATPTEFADCLIDRFEYVEASGSVGLPVRLRVYNVFKGWLETHWQMEADAEALPSINEFARGPLARALPAAGKRLAELTERVSGQQDGNLVPRLLSSLGRTGTSLTVYSSDPAPAPVVTKAQLAALRNPKTQCSILDFDPLELARQFTLIESRMFCAIRAEELLGLEWTKKETSRAVNVRAMITLSTDLTNLVADTILQSEEPKKRAVIIKQWIKICIRCLELANYDSLMAIVCSLNSSMVLRLKKTWDQVSAKTKARLEELKAVVDVGKNYAILRQRLQNHCAPCIPFVGMYLTDLTFIDVGNQTTRQLPSSDPEGSQPRTVINFDKYLKTAKIIGQLQGFQVPYKLQPVMEMQDWMERQISRVRNSDQANVQIFYRRSLLLEPREHQPQPPLTAASSFSSTRSTDSAGHLSKENAGSMAPTTNGRFDLWAGFHLGGANKEKHASS